MRSLHESFPKLAHGTRTGSITIPGARLGDFSPPNPRNHPNKEESMANIIPALIAALVAFPLLVALFVPILAIEARRRGGLSAGRVLCALAAVVYLCGLLAYVLIPIPETASYRCARSELNLIAQFLPTGGQDGMTPRGPDLFPAVANVILFLPFGFLVRILARRGVLIAATSGFLVSLLVETTQLTGVWGLFPCAYRIFDTGDLLTNTTGAILGSLIALLFTRGPSRTTPPRFARLTKTRRASAMFADYITYVIVTVTVSVGFVLIVRTTDLLAVDPLQPAARLWDSASVLAVSVAFTVHALFILITGTTIGEHALLIRATEERIGGPLLARPIRVLAGFGGVMLASQLPAEVSGPLSAVLIVVNVVSLFTTTDARGFPQFAAGMWPRMEHVR
ncbi:VanZ family protein [Clavibacter michiganensis]|uniref:VanZ family protein n=1 Tax=Clavibacter michiganensis TaxID=28447 RepID=UPI0015E21657|nr:VanZ family protein [Clavibacter michiganensis]